MKYAMVQIKIGTILGMIEVLNKTGLDSTLRIIKNAHVN